MPTATPTQLLSPEEIAVRAGHQIPFLQVPERSTVFAERAMRVRQRAADHPMRDFLLFAAGLMSAQHDALQRYRAIPLPDAAALDAASRAGMAPLPALLWPRDAAWRADYRAFVRSLLPGLSKGREGDDKARIEQLRHASDAWLEQQADRLLGGAMLGLDMAAAPFIAAALQTQWVHLVIATAAARGSDRLAPFGRTDDATRCPCCASLPTASVSRIGAEQAGHRYLHCSLCSTQWHMVRIKCTRCQSTAGIHYQSLRPAGEETIAASEAKAVVEAETCDTCGHYLKIVHMERDANVEPVADDLATLTLDLLVSEARFERHGVNLMLLFGDPDATSDPAGP